MSDLLDLSANTGEFDNEESLAEKPQKIGVVTYKEDYMSGYNLALVFKGHQAEFTNLSFGNNEQIVMFGPTYTVLRNERILPGNEDETYDVFDVSRFVVES